MKKYSADFETATWCEDETWVWAWATCDIDNFENIQYGTDIESFIDFCYRENNPEIYFHNQKFDGSFIISHLLRKMGYTWVKDKKEAKDKTFTTLISNMGQFYMITIYFKVGNKSIKKVNIYDSLKIIPFPVSDIPEIFGLEENKLEIDYKEVREKGHILTKHEKDYIKGDVIIVAKALKQLFDQKLTRMTQGSNSIHDYKNMLTKSKFEHYFPSLDILNYQEIRKSYKGGFTYLHPDYKEKDIGEGSIIDVNSLYPYIMYTKMLPFGEPLFFNGEYKEDKIYPLYIQMITCKFKLKKDKIPTIQIRHNSLKFIANEYLESSVDKAGVDEEVCLVLTNIDLKLFFEQYDVDKESLQYVSGWKFKGITGLFNDFIDKYLKMKIEAELAENIGLRTIAKLQMNSLYGKYASSMIGESKIPYLGKDEIVHYKSDIIEVTKEEFNPNNILYVKRNKKYYRLEERKGIYIPLASFVTSYAREQTIQSSQKIMDYSISKYGINKYVYSDTDSIHCLLTKQELEELCEIDKTKLGAWKYEGNFTKARYLRQKCYVDEFEVSVEEYEKLKKKQEDVIYFKDGKMYKLSITCAGMPKRCHKQVTWENYKTGFTCSGKLTYKHVKGGVILIDTDFTIKDL